MMMLEQLLQQAAEEYRKWEEEMAADERRVIAAGFDSLDFAQMKCIMAFMPEISETAKFLDIMLNEFENLQSAHLAKHLVSFMLQAAEFLRLRVEKAGVSHPCFAIQPREHSERVLGALAAKADQIIEKHERLRQLTH